MEEGEGRPTWQGTPQGGVISPLFDFLGFHVQMRGQKLLITPQQQKVQKLLQEVRSWLKTHQAVSAEVVLRHLNPLIRGWAMYYRHVVSKQTFQKVDSHIWRALWHWAKRRHPKKPKRWIYRRYFESRQYGATFYAESQNRRGKRIRLGSTEYLLSPLSAT